MPLLPGRYGLGYRPDREDARDERFAPGFAAAPLSLGTVGSIMRGLAPVQDQGNTSSCVAHAIRTALVIREMLMGVETVVEPSRLALYWNARAQHGGQRNDAGTYIRDAFKVLQRIGVADESKHPFSTFTLKVNKQPPVRSYIEGHARAGGKYARLASFGDERIGEIRNALSLGLPVVFGTSVDRVFQEHRGPGVLGRPRNALLGGHAMCIVGDDDKREAFLVQNSWGTGWGDLGFAWLDYGWFTWTMTRDLWVVDGWRNIQTAAT